MNYQVEAKIVWFDTKIGQGLAKLVETDLFFHIEEEMFEDKKGLDNAGHDSITVTIDPSIECYPFNIAKISWSHDSDRPRLLRVV